ncbi:T-cell receptor-associated transmembrane adapter 1 [Heterocephalus glaber]|nr:T-cell receptor-associated transmembrane adapter 1 [Heterocephalus glaber]
MRGHVNKPQNQTSRSPTATPKGNEMEYYDTQPPGIPELRTKKDLEKVKSEIISHITAEIAPIMQGMINKSREDTGSTECPFFLWGLLALLGLALIISLIFNISHYIEKQRQDKMYRYSDNYIPSFKGKYRKPRKQNTHSSDKEREKQLYAMDDNMTKSNLVESSLPESQEIEENIHDDPIRLFGLIRAKREPMD